MKTSDSWYTSINSLESPIEQADSISRSHSSSPNPSLPTSGPSPSTSNTENVIQRQHARALPYLIGSALISGFSLLGLLGFLVMQSHNSTQSIPAPQESVVR